MSLGQIIQSLGESLKKLRQFNAMSDPPMFEQAAMTWALDELKSRFPDKYVSVRCEKGIYTNGDQHQECGVYVGDLGYHYAPTFSMALKKVIEAYRQKFEPTPEPVVADDAVMPTAASEAIADANQEQVTPAN